ncbi:glycosyltransferase family 2 protein [Curtanaerobium respiraculi]|uniref:glycosyltransferase family 2 protein n=1 Tax=Curtanaerobium respiraculi TaxID=2949669 RepID=UPI0024B39F66|nr:glycosyltransferase [Curtanaerobium respiraculi]
MVPAVSVVVSVYNTEQYVHQCLDSLCGQTLADIEIICVDDGSTDDSPAIMDGFASRDARVQVLHKRNSGYGDSMNRGIDVARGRYIGIVEPDDWTDTCMYETLYSAACRHGFPDIVKASYTRVAHAGTADEKLAPSWYANRVAYVDQPFTIDQDAELIFHHPSIWTGLYRTDFLKQEQIRFLPIPGSGWADNPFMMEAMVVAKSIVYVDEPVYYYREFDNALSGGVKDPSIIGDRWIEMDEILKRRGVVAPRVLEAHYSRGCSYIQMLDVDFPDSCVARDGARRIFARLDGAAIMRSRRILPEYQNVYLAHCTPEMRFRLRVLRKFFSRP